MGTAGASPVGARVEAVVDGGVIDGLEEDEEDGGTAGVEEPQAARMRAAAARTAAPVVRCLRAGWETGLSLTSGGQF